MLPSGEEIRRSLAGALALARGDVRGMGLFDVGFGGFWRSFAAPILAAPLYLLLAAQRPRPSDAEGAPAALSLGGEIVAYLLDIVTFPLLALALTAFLGLGARYVPLVVATNWATPPQIALFLAAVTLGGIAAPLLPTLLLGATMAALLYQWFVIRTALGTTGGNAAAFVALNVIVGVVLNRALAALL